MSKIIPIFRSTHEYIVGNNLCTRKQFLLTVSHAITVHTSLREPSLTRPSRISRRRTLRPASAMWLYHESRLSKASCSRPPLTSMTSLPAPTPTPRPGQRRSTVNGALLRPFTPPNVSLNAFLSRHTSIITNTPVNSSRALLRPLFSRQNRPNREDERTRKWSYGCAQVALGGIRIGQAQKVQGIEY